MAIRNGVRGAGVLAALALVLASGCTYRGDTSATGTGANTGDARRGSPSGGVVSPPANGPAGANTNPANGGTPPAPAAAGGNGAADR